MKSLGVSENMSLGEVFTVNVNDGFKLIRIDYAPKKWWQFWKKKQVIGYEMEYV